MRRLWAASAAIVLCAALLPLAGLGADPTEDVGLTGSLWVSRGEGTGDTYYTLHPDGTVVTMTGNSTDQSRAVGLGVWEPTGERSLTATWAYADADPLTHMLPGTSTYRSEWLIDEPAESATLTYNASFERLSGDVVPAETGSRTLERLHMQPLPTFAEAPVPPEPAWSLALGPASHGPGAGSVSTISPSHASDPPEYLVAHADGTYFYTSPYGGNGVGLWAPSGEETAALTSWFGEWPNHSVAQLVIELKRVLSSYTLGSYGSSEAFEGSFSATSEAFRPMDPDAPLASPDPALWPSTGSLWVESLEDGQAARTAYLSDGTVISVHPEYGVGAGLWQPIDADTFASWIGYATQRSVDWQVRAESTISADGETLTSDYILEKKSNDTAPETGTSTATRVRPEA
jgi:hypothetical protein